MLRFRLRVTLMSKQTTISTAYAKEAYANFPPTEGRPCAGGSLHSAMPAQLAHT